METQSEAIQYLSFTLEAEVYALEIAKVREVLEQGKLTKIPQAPPFMRGVINLRGAVVPVVDLKQKFGMGPTVQTVNTCIIIVEIEVDGEWLLLGALADSVREVIELEADQIEPPPSIGTRLKTEFIKGMGKQDDHFLIILDLDRVFSLEEMSQVIEVGVGPLASSE
ncbi:MAG: chemotaxis protein CheW [bacterium]|nr:chemotaxis protein CheW [bacterium]